MKSKSQTYRNGNRIWLIALACATILLASCKMMEEPIPDPGIPAPSTALAAPGGLTATPAGETVELSWTGVADASSYRVYRNGNATLLITSEPITGTTYTDSAIVTGSTYSYTVRALKGTLESDNSDAATADPPTPTPGNFMAIPGNNIVTLTWNAVIGATHYHLYRDEAPLVTLHSPDLTHTDHTAINFNYYSYTVRSSGNNGVESPHSTIADAYPTRPPNAPRNLTATLEDGVTLTWDEVPRTDSYRIYRDNMLLATDIPGTDTTYIDRSIVGSTTYSYTVRLVNSNRAESLDSTAATAIVPVINFDNLDVAGNAHATGLWSDGITMWIADGLDSKIYAYNLMTEARDPGKDFNTLPGAGNNSPRGLWSDGITMWTLNSSPYKIFAYNLASKEHDAFKDFNNLRPNGADSPIDIWSNKTPDIPLADARMWILDILTYQIHIYNMDTREYVSSQNLNILDSENSHPLGLWSNGTTLWVSNYRNNKIYAYDLEDSTYTPAEDFDTPIDIGNNRPADMWANDDTMFVLDFTSYEMFTYNLATKEHIP